MTAINVVTSEAAAHLVTDGVAYLPDGEIHAFGTKTFTAPHMPMALATRGIAAATFRLGPMLADLHPTFDDLVARIEQSLPIIFRQYVAQFDVEQMDPEAAAGLQILDLVIAGWSAERHRAESYMIRTNEIDLVPDGFEGQALLPKAFKLMALDSVVACPFPLPEVLRKSPPIDLDASFDDAKLRANLIKLMELQRASLYPPILPGRTDRHIVGGFVQMTTVTELGISQRIIHRWPEDRVGEKITLD